MDSAALFVVLAALGGVSMVILRLRGRPRPPTWLALGHGVVAVTGVGTLGWVGAHAGLPPLAWTAFVVFLLAALGGLSMFFLYHLKNRALPVGLMLGHGLVALTGVILLLVALGRAGPSPETGPPRIEPAQPAPAAPAQPLSEGPTG